MEDETAEIAEFDEEAGDEHGEGIFKVHGLFCLGVVAEDAFAQDENEEEHHENAHWEDVGFFLGEMRASVHSNYFEF